MPVQPAFIVGTYNEDGTPNAMNAAWGCIADADKIAIYVAHDHKTMQNILSRGAFTVSMADAAHMVEADYVGIVSGNDVPDKFAKAGLHAVKSEFVDAPLIEEFPMTLECTMLSYDTDSELLVGEIANVCAEESILNDAGRIDPAKLRPISYDSVNHDYLVLGEKVGNAFHDGAKLK